MTKKTNEQERKLKNYNNTTKTNARIHEIVAYWSDKNRCSSCDDKRRQGLISAGMPKSMLFTGL